MKFKPFECQVLVSASSTKSSNSLHVCSIDPAISHGMTPSPSKTKEDGPIPFNMSKPGMAIQELNIFFFLAILTFLVGYMRKLTHDFMLSQQTLCRVEKCASRRIKARGEARVRGSNGQACM